MKKCNRCRTIVTDNIPFCPACYKESTGNDMVLSNDICEYFNNKDFLENKYNTERKVLIRRSKIISYTVVFSILVVIAITISLYYSDGAAIKRSVVKYYKKNSEKGVELDVHIINKYKLKKSMENIENERYKRTGEILQIMGENIDDLSDVYYVTVNVNGKVDHVICYDSESDEGWRTVSFW